MVNVTKSHKLLMLLTPQRSRTESYGNLENHGEKHQSSSAIKLQITNVANLIHNKLSPKSSSPNGY